MLKFEINKQVQTKDVVIIMNEGNQLWPLCTFTIENKNLNKEI